MIEAKSSQETADEREVIMGLVWLFHLFSRPSSWPPLSPLMVARWLQLLQAFLFMEQLLKQEEMG